MDIPFKWILPIESLPALEEEVAVLVDTLPYGIRKDFGYLWQYQGYYKWELENHFGIVLAWWPLPPKEEECQSNKIHQDS